MTPKRPCRKCGGTGKESDPVAIGHSMRRLRQRWGVSLREMARRLDISAPYLSDLELGKREWTEEKISTFRRKL